MNRKVIVRSRVATTRDSKTRKHAYCDGTSHKSSECQRVARFEKDVYGG